MHLVRSSFLVAGLTLLAACGTSETASSPLEPASPALAASFERRGAVAQVSGHANFTYGEGLFQTTSFHAIRNADGSVSGTVQLNSHGDGARAHGTVACMIVNGNEATIGGPVTESTFGATAWFIRLRDNGEGSKAAPDEWTDFIYSLNPNADPATICAAGQFYQLVPIQGGNVQVR